MEMESYGKELKRPGSPMLRFVLESIFVILFIIELGIRWGSLKRLERDMSFSLRLLYEAIHLLPGWMERLRCNSCLLSSLLDSIH